MRSAMSPTLQKRQVIGILDSGRLCESANRFRQQLGVIRNFRPLWNLRLG
jgi:hypothetical protein